MGDDAEDHRAARRGRRARRVRPRGRQPLWPRGGRRATRGRERAARLRRYSIDSAGGAHEREPLRRAAGSGSPARRRRSRPSSCRRPQRDSIAERVQQRLDEARVAGDRDPRRAASRTRRSPAGRSRPRDGSRAKSGSCSSQFCHEPDRPWMKTIGGPEPSSTTLTRRPSISPSAGAGCQSTSSQGERPRRAVVAGRVGQAWQAHPPCDMRIIGARRASPHAHRHRHRLDAAPLLGPARRVAPAPLRRRPALRGAARLGDQPPARTSSCSAAIAETHSDEADPRAPSPTRARSRRSRAWHDAGHFIHITQPSRASVATRPPSAGWSDIGLPLRRPALLLRQGRALRRDRASTC